jgi:hypothetical protein
MAAAFALVLNLNRAHKGTAASPDDLISDECHDSQQKQKTAHPSHA